MAAGRPGCSFIASAAVKSSLTSSLAESPGPEAEDATHRALSVVRGRLPDDALHASDEDMSLTVEYRQRAGLQAGCF